MDEGAELDKQLTNFSETEEILYLIFVRPKEGVDKQQNH